MKKLAIILSLCIATISCKGNENKSIDSTDATTKTEHNKLKRYGVESGIIEYKTTISGKMMGSTISGEGTANLYFKDWGALELKEDKSSQTTYVKFFGKTTEEKTNQHEIHKLDNGESYSVDFTNKTIHTQKDPMMQYFMQTNSDVEKAGKNMMEAMGGKKIGDETFKGYNCEIWELLGGKQWVHKGVMLKMEMTLMGITTINEATNVEFNINVPDKYFVLPDFPITKVESVLGIEDMNFDQEDMEDLDANMEMVSKLSYEDWKKMALADKEYSEMQNMSEEELHQAYDMMQKMIKMRAGK
jgi:hypothetical protein